MKFCFVILHYLGAVDTTECIDSIQQINGGKDAQIIIVDNYSNNGSAEQLEDYILKYDNCILLRNSENLGFARGNNVGYQYAREHFDDPCIIVANNDTIIHQKDFLDRIKQRYETDQFDVLGPDIISLIDEGHQNPIKMQQSKKTVKKQIIKYSLLLLLSKLGVYEFFQYKFGNSEKKNSIRLEKPKSRIIHGEALHGSCLIFSPKYAEQMVEAFCPDTFLYKEEMILAKKCEKYNLKMYLDAEIEIYHKEDSSTNLIVQGKKEKREFLFKNLIQSGKVLLRYL